MAEHSFSMYLEYSFRKTDWLYLISGFHLDPHFSYFKYPFEKSNPSCPMTRCHSDTMGLYS